MNAGLGIDRTNKSAKCHATTKEAFDCYASYLVSTGHERLSSREFRQPQGGILVLTKPCRYGAKMRKGKNDLKGTSAARFMPASRRKTTRAGIVIG